MTETRTRRRIWFKVKDDGSQTRIHDPKLIHKLNQAIEEEWRKKQALESIAAGFHPSERRVQA